MAPDICIILPTIREPEALRAYVENATRHDFDTRRLHAVLITEDFCDTDGMQAMLEDLPITGEVFDEQHRTTWLTNNGLDDYTHLIPAASHAQTSFGLLYAWANNFEYGIFIDDDTRPHPDTDFFGTHLNTLCYEGPITAVASDTNWVNVLYQNHDEHGLYPRGYPYSAMNETPETATTSVSNVVASQGLWTNVPDLDAVRILMDGNLEGQADTRLTKADYTEDFVVEPGNYLTVCSMNLAFRREIIPAFYQLPMDDNPWNVGRFDDIWSGIFLKRACDILDDMIVSGTPLCQHNKAPRSTFGDLTNEAPGLELNEHLWKHIDDTAPNATSYAEVYKAMANALTATDPEYANAEFLQYMGEYMHEWLDCLTELRPPTNQHQATVTADD